MQEHKVFFMPTRAGHAHEALENVCFVGDLIRGHGMEMLVRRKGSGIGVNIVVIRAQYDERSGVRVR